VSPLSPEAVAGLERLIKRDLSARVRMRAHSILLSHRKMGIDVIAAFYDVSRDTVSGWIDRWERDGLRGLRDRPRSGAPRMITEADRALIRSLAGRYPNSSRTVINMFAARTGKTISESTIRRILKEAPKHCNRLS
jgi:transposase